MAKTTMNPTIRDILRVLDASKRTPESSGVGLRLDLAEIVLAQMRTRGWSQRDLARAADVKESFVSRILHSSANCTFETVGKLLFALEVKAELRESPQEAVCSPAAEFGTEARNLRFADYSEDYSTDGKDFKVYETKKVESKIKTREA